MSAAQSVVAAQQDFARKQGLAPLFESLTTALLYAKPADAATFLAAECARMASEGPSYRAAPVNGTIDTEEDAAAYLEKHRIQPLLEELFASLLVNKSADPLAFLQAECARLAEVRASDKPVSALFTDADLAGLFSLFDPVSNNYITADQARTALRNLGLKGLDGVPEAPGTRIELPQFCAIARAALDAERTL